MVVRADHKGAPAHGCLFLLTAIVLLVAPIVAKAQGYSNDRPANHGSIAPLSGQLLVFDPAQSSFLSLLSYGAMQQIAPTVFGDFQSPAALVIGQGFSGPMSQNGALDPAVSAVLDQAFQQLQPTLQPSGGSAEVEEFDVGSDDLGVGAGDPTTGDARIRDKTTTQRQRKNYLGLASACRDQSLKDVQTGDNILGPQGNDILPAAFPRGISSGVSPRDPLGDLGPRGNPLNLASIGIAGEWCRPGPTPFDETSPLEDMLVWISAGLFITSVFVFYCSRGFRLPA